MKPQPNEAVHFTTFTSASCCMLPSLAAASRIRSMHSDSCSACPASSSALLYTPRRCFTPHNNAPAAGRSQWSAPVLAPPWSPGADSLFVEWFQSSKPICILTATITALYRIAPSSQRKSALIRCASEEYLWIWRCGQSTNHPHM